MCISYDICHGVQVYPLLDMVDAIETHEHLNDVLAKFTALGISLVLCLYTVCMHRCHHT